MTTIRLTSPLRPVLLALLLAGCSGGPSADLAPYREAADRLIASAEADSSVIWGRLAEMCDTFGPRFSGSQNLEDAISWVMAWMKADGLENVQKQPAMVPHWVRGEESLLLVSPRRRALPMSGLGGSVGTPAGGIRGEVLVVNDREDLRARAAEARGRVVLFDVPFTTYGETVDYRTNGATWAAEAGAVASLIRSVTPYSQQSPHTGAMDYQEGARRIPHAAVTVEDARMMHRMQERGQRIEVVLRMSARSLPDVMSGNVMGEITGREFPEEVVVLGGHIDSWDVGSGAMDDGGGVVAAWWAVKMMKDLGLRPRRTVRAVGWTSEENSLNGGRVYRDSLGTEQSSHVLAIESDGGVFMPQGFGFTGSDDAFAIIEAIGRLLDPIGAGRMTRGGGGADIGPLMQDGVPGMGLNVAGNRYFWYHHSDADTPDKLSPTGIARCAAALAVVAYVVAEMPERLPR